MRSRLASQPKQHHRLTLSLGNSGKRNKLKGERVGSYMGGEINEALDPNHNALPFRLSDIEIQPKFFDFHPMIFTVRKEIMFQWKLIRHEWNKQHVITIIAGVLAIVLGTFNNEILNGGDAQQSGLEGLQQSGATAYFQMILSIVCWGWFLYQLLRLFPIMRTHSVTLMLIWGGFGLSQILFHVENKLFPFEFELSEMMGGLLVTLVCIFFLYFFPTIQLSFYRRESIHIILHDSLTITLLLGIRYI